MMKILAIEPYYKGSHQHWLDGMIKHSSHKIQNLTLPGLHWKWRMHGGALELARQLEQLDDFYPDLILFTDMMDVSLFLSLVRKKFAAVKTALYFHENQFAYPISNMDQDKALDRDPHYGFINMTSALSVDQVFFNSHYNRDSFLEGSRKLLQSMPDYNSPNWVRVLEEKSSVLPLGLEIDQFNCDKKDHIERVILWNHRWEYDKNPEVFFNALGVMKERGIPFKLNLIGKRGSRYPKVFDQALKNFKDEILQQQEIASRADYLSVLQQSDILPVTSNQEYFGISTAEAICSGVCPLLPNRLAYPELIPKDYHSLYLYSDQKDLIEKLAVRLTEPLPNTDPLQEYCQQFSWKKMINEYDRKLELI